MPTSKQEWALEAASKGLRVLPLQHTLLDGSCSCGKPDCGSVGKHPATLNGVKDATTSLAHIRAWWENDPDANIGVHGGPGYVWIDLDVKKGNGIKALADYLGTDQWNLEDLTYSVRTPTGGLHLYFKCDGAIGDRVNILGPGSGIDIRGAGGYVAGPGSTIGDKAYEVVKDKPIAQVPQSLLSLIGAARQKDLSDAAVELDLETNIVRARNYLKERPIAVSGSGGNNHTFVTCCHLKDFAISKEKAMELLNEDGGWNERCDPAWSDAELEAILDHSFSYGKDRIGSKASEGYAGLSIDDLLAGTGITVDDIDTQEKIDATSKWDRETYNLNEFRHLNVEYDFIVPDWFPAQGYSAFLASRGVGKTTILLDICMHLATDTNWNGISTETGWTVCYIIGEDMPGLRMRVNAWCKEFNEGKDIPDGERLLLMNFPINLLDADEIEKFVNFAIRRTAGKTKVLFVLDTFQRMIQAVGSSGGMSDDVSMAKAVHHLDYMARSLSRQSKGGPVFVAFHPPKNNKGVVHGSALLENASSAIIQIDAQPGGLKKMYVTRLKGGPETSEMYFAFKSVEIGGIDKHGRPYSAAVIDAKNHTDGGTPVEVKQLDTDMATLIVKAVRASPKWWSELGGGGSIALPSITGILYDEIRKNSSHEAKTVIAMAERLFDKRGADLFNDAIDKHRVITKGFKAWAGSRIGLDFPTQEGFKIRIKKTHVDRLAFEMLKLTSLDDGQNPVAPGVQTDYAGDEDDGESGLDTA